MPSVRTKWAQNKQNYLRNKENRREVSRIKYGENSDKERAGSQASDKKRAASRASYWKNPESKRASSRMSSYTRYWKDPEAKGHPPILVIERILSLKGHPLIP